MKTLTGGRISAWTAVALGVAALATSACSRGGGMPSVVPFAGTAVRSPSLQDRGERPSSSSVDVGVVLRLNHRGELERIVEQIANPRSGRYHRFLSAQAFDERFAPTPQQEASVVAGLRKDGFTMVRAYRNRTFVQARAPARIVENVFHTRIHDFDEPRFGRRYANVVPARVPRAFAAIVEGVELSNVVLAHAGPRIVPSVRRSANQAAQPPSNDAVRNGGFETGRLKPWFACGSAPKASTSTLHPQTGSFDAVTGSPERTSGEPKGTTGICQTVTIPPNATLDASLYRVSNQKNSSGAAQIVALLNGNGKVVATLDKTLKNHPRWVRFESGLGQYAGQRLTLFFGVRGSGDDEHFVTQFVDDVTLTGLVVPTPSPSPSASPAPSASPNVTPTPVITPTPAITPTPLPAGPDSPIAGPTYGPDTFDSEPGWGPRAVADGFDFPVQHGYNGQGVTAAVVIDDTIDKGDFAAFLSEYQISRTGTVTTENVNGGAPAGNDSLESSLDVETIAGLAPGANVVVYDIPDLSNVSIEAAYAQILSDSQTPGAPHASVVNTSIDECEAVDSTFTSDVEQDAVEGAALGITFVASSGDWGSTCYDDGTFPFGVNAPADAPHFLDVGGNESDSVTPPVGDSGIARPAVWQNCDAGFNADYCASGGGVSTVFTIPAYQANLGGAASGTNRNAPDIAFPAVFGDIYYGGSSGMIVGTSWASPIAVALLAETTQICGPLGWVNPAVYSAFAAHGEVPDFIDVTSGSNAGFNAAGSAGYKARPGYDNASGIGMPSGASFAAAMCRGS